MVRFVVSIWWGYGGADARKGGRVRTLDADMDVILRLFSLAGVFIRFGERVCREGVLVVAFARVTALSCRVPQYPSRVWSHMPRRTPAALYSTSGEQIAQEYREWYGKLVVMTAQPAERLDVPKDLRFSIVADI